MGKAAVISSFGPSGEGGAVSLAPCPVAGIALSMNRYRAMEMRIRAGKALLLVGDVLALLLAMIVGGWLAGIVFANGTDSVFAARLWNDAESRQVVVILCSTFVAMVFIWRRLSHYSNRKSFWSEQREILMVLAGALVIDAALAFMIKSHVSRGWMISFWAVAFLLVPLTRLLVKLLRMVISL
jgi:F0F1-type ATP synthase membrane subunit c/vacuolar-type H+-ATPase subunit K